MDQDTNQQFEQQQEQFRIIRETEQNRIFLEMQDEATPSKNGWKIVVAFLIVVIALIWAFNAKAQTITFIDKEVEQCALRVGDTDGDGHISQTEADSLKSLNLSSYRTHMFRVTNYDDLAEFPNLEKLWLGESLLDTVDLSQNLNLKYVVIQSDNLKTVVIAVGCHPQFNYPYHSGEIIVKRILNPDAPGAMFFQY